VDIQLGRGVEGERKAKVLAVPKVRQSFDEAAITKRAEADLDPADPSARYPYACRLDEKKNRLYVSSLGRNQRSL